MIERFALRRNVTMSIVAFAVNILLVFVSYRLVILRGGLDALGLWSTLMAWIYVIRMGDVGMATAAVRYVARCDSETESTRIRSYVDTGLGLNGALFLLLAGVGYLAISWNLESIIHSGAADQAIAASILPLILAGFVLSNLSGLILGGADRPASRLSRRVDYDFRDGSTARGRCRIGPVNGAGRARDWSDQPTLADDTRGLLVFRHKLRVLSGMVGLCSLSNSISRL